MKIIAAIALTLASIAAHAIKPLPCPRGGICCTVTNPGDCMPDAHSPLNLSGIVANR